MREPNYLEFFIKIVENINKAHKLNEHGVERYHVKHRAFFLLKLAIFLDKLRGHDYSSQIISVRRFTNAYIANKLHLSPQVVSEFSVDDIILTLYSDVASYALPDNIRNGITNEYPIGAEYLQSHFDTTESIGPFLDDEWNPELLERLKLRWCY